MGCHLGAWSLTAGIDNLFDETCAVANFCEWDVVAGTAAKPIVVNEPSRFAYTRRGYSW